MVVLPLFPNVMQDGRGQRGGNFAGEVLSVMIHHPAPGGPQTGRGEKATITVINGEEGLPGNNVMRSPSCRSQGEWKEAGEERLKGREMEVPKGCSFIFCVCLRVFSPQKHHTHSHKLCVVVKDGAAHLSQRSTVISDSKARKGSTPW